MPGASPVAAAPAAAPSNARRLKNRCSGVARLSGISQPRRRMTFIGLIPPEWLRKEYGHAGSQASHGCGSLHMSSSCEARDPSTRSRRALAELQPHSAARLAATIWSAVLPVSSAMWSNLKVNEPTPAVAERTSMMRSPISDFRHLGAHHVPAVPALAGVEAENLAAPAGQDRVHLGGGVGRADDLDQMDRLEQHRLALRQAFDDADARRGLERHVGGIRRCDTSRRPARPTTSTTWKPSGPCLSALMTPSSTEGM